MIFFGFADSIWHNVDILKDIIYNRLFFMKSDLKQKITYFVQIYDAHSTNSIIAS